MSRLEEVKKTIESGKAVLGIELGSTRIKAVLVDQMGTVIETGGFDWENSLVKEYKSVIRIYQIKSKKNMILL